MEKNIITILELELSKVFNKGLDTTEETLFEEELKIVNSPKIKKALTNFFSDKTITERYLNTLSSDKHVVDLIYNFLLENEYNIVSKASVSSDDDYFEDATKQYLAQIGKIPLYTAEEEKKIFQKLSKTKNADKRREISNEIVEHNLKLVVSVAKRYSANVFDSASMEFLDLIQEGNGGLMESVEKFDVTKGYRFSTYATWWIRQAITNSLTNQNRSIRLPLRVYELVSKLGKIESRMTIDLQRKPTAEELAKELNVTPDRIYELQKISVVPISIETPIGEEEDSYLKDVIVDERIGNPEDIAIQSSLPHEISILLDRLSLREREILELRFGLKDGVQRTFEEIGKYYGVTRERVRQIELKALRKLRYPKVSGHLKDYIRK